MLHVYDKLKAKGCYYDEQAANRIITFAEKFCFNTTGIPAPIKLMPFQKEILQPIFGWKKPNGTRAFNKALIFIPKKNGKSLLTSIVCLYLLACDNEFGAEIYSAACNSKQASLIFTNMKNMIELSPQLNKQLTVIPYIKRIVHAKSKSYFQVLTADGSTNQGLNIHGAVVDEIAFHQNRAIYSSLYYGGSARRQPLFFGISTASNNQSGIGFEEYTKAKSIINNTSEITDTFCYIKEAKPDSDWTKEETWLEANPALNNFLDIDKFRQECIEAQAIPSKASEFKQYRLNIWSGDSISSFIDQTKWRENINQFKEEELLGETCVASLDLGINRDISSLVLLFTGKQPYKIICKFWIAGDNATRRQNADRVPYTDWAKQNLITLTEGDDVDYQQIKEDIKAMAEQYDIKELLLDRYNSTHLCQSLIKEGFTPPINYFPQSFISMNEPTRLLERLYLSKKLAHNGNPILTWMAHNCVAETDPLLNIRLSKRKSRERIDGMIALTMCIATLVSESDVSLYDNPNASIFLK